MAEDTVHDFLDDQVRNLEKYIVDPRRKQEVRELNGYFLKAQKEGVDRAMEGVASATATFEAARNSVDGILNKLKS